MKSTAKETNWFEELLDEVVPAVPACSQLFPHTGEQKEISETRMNKGIVNSVPAVPAVPAKKHDSEKIFSITRRQEAIIKAWLYHIGEPEEDHYLVLNKCRRDPKALAYYLERAAESKREERRAKVLAMLAERPEVQRAFVTDMSADPDNVIVTIAIRNVASFEMLIPKDKHDPFMLFELINKGSVQ